MKKSCLVLAIAILAPVTLAGVVQPPIDLIEQDLIPGRIVEVAQSHQAVYTTGPGPVTPIDPDPGLRSGPIAPGDRDTGMGFGSALVTGRGGNLYTPQQQAGREIDRLIRKLD